MQNPNLCAADAQKAAQLIVQTLSKLRDDEHVQNFPEKVKREVTRLEIDEQEPGLPCPKKALRKLGAYFRYGTGDLINTKQLKLITVHQYYGAIDKVVTTIKYRFDQPDYKIYVNLDQALLNDAAIKNIDDSLAVLEKHYENDFDNWKRYPLHLQTA